MAKSESSAVVTPLVDISRLSKVLSQFATERDWDQFHSPKNLVMALAGETGELVEIFQWMSEESSKLAGDSPSTSKAVRDELADVLIYLVRIADKLGVDLNAAVFEKLAQNASKYPVSTSRGNSRKYTDL